MVSSKRATINNCKFRKSLVTATLRGVVGDFYVGSCSFEDLA